MTFTELLTAIYELTGRSDLVSQTKEAVKASTLKAHMTDFYPRDVVEVGIDSPVSTYLHQIDYIDIVSNFRALKYLRKYDPVAAEVGTFFCIIDAAEVLDSYGLDRVDVCYIAGRTLNVKSSTEVGDLLLGCYVLPDVTETGYSSWIASQFPYVIVYEAARVMFKIVGDTEQSRTYSQLGAEQLDLLMRTAIQSEGY